MPASRRSSPRPPIITSASESAAHETVLGPKPAKRRSLPPLPFKARTITLGSPPISRALRAEENPLTLASGAASVVYAWVASGGFFVSEHGVEGGEQLSHACGERDHLGLSGADEPFKAGSDQWAGSEGGHGGQEEQLPGSGPSAGTEGSAPPDSALSNVGRESRKLGDGLAGQASKFGHIGQEPGGHKRPDAGSRLQQPPGLAQFPAGANQLQGETRQVRNFLPGQRLHTLQRWPTRALKHLGLGLAQAGSPSPEPLSAPLQQVAKLFLLGMKLHPSPAGVGQIASDHLGVDAVDLGRRAQRLGHGPNPCQDRSSAHRRRPSTGPEPAPAHNRRMVPRPPPRLAADVP